MAATDGKSWSLERDADMAAMLWELPNGLGFMGSDRYDELDEDVQSWLAFAPIVSTAIRFAVATSEAKAERMATKLARVEPLVIATSYAKKTVATLADMWDMDPTEAADLVEPLYFGGSIESKPDLIPRVDGVLDIIDQGTTMAANRLTIIADNLGTVSVGAVWRSDV
jgi:ATP phosphoribosyltransferase